MGWCIDRLRFLIRSMKQLIIIITLVFLCSCSKEEFDVQNLNGGEVLAIGHGGMGVGYSYPMNSYEAIRYALEIGADGVEIDIDMTKDGVLVAFHQENLEDATNGTGKIYDHTWAELQDLRFKGVPYSSYKLRTVDEILDHLPTISAYKYFFDCKNFNPDDSEEYVKTFNSALISLIDKYGLDDNVFVELKRESLIADFTNRKPKVRTIVYQPFDKAMILARQYNLDGMILPMESITEEQVRLAHESNIRVTVFNVLTKEDNKRALRLNVEYIETDKVKNLLELLK